MLMRAHLQRALFRDGAWVSTSAYLSLTTGASRAGSAARAGHRDERPWRNASPSRPASSDRVHWAGFWEDAHRQAGPTSRGESVCYTRCPKLNEACSELNGACRLSCSDERQRQDAVTAEGHWQRASDRREILTTHRAGWMCMRGPSQSLVDLAIRSQRSVPRTEAWSFSS